MKTLQDICHLITDGKHGDCQNEDRSGFYFVSCKDVRDGWIDYSGSRQITKKDFLDTHRRTQLEENDIVITNSGTIGRMALVRNRPETNCTTFQKSVAIIKPNQGEVIPKWLYYSLIANKDDLIAFASGTAQKNLLLKDMRAFQVSVPPLPTQRRIAAILSAYDDLIENNTRRIKILEEMAQNLYREWFVKFRFPGHEHARFVDSPLGRIPEGWDILPCSSLANYVNGFAFKPKDWGSEGKPIIKIRELKNGITSETPRNMGFNIPEKSLIDDGDVLFSWSADLNIYYWKEGPSILNQHIFKVIPLDGFSRIYCYHALLESIPKFRSLSIGATMQHIKRSALDQVFLITPKKELRLMFEYTVESILIEQIILKKKVLNLRTTRDLLLPKLISGEVDVSEIDITIPVEVKT